LQKKVRVVEWSFSCGFAGVFEGGFGNSGESLWCNRGEIVVNCVVIVDDKLLVFDDEK
jgi:hypothetical protein